MPDDQRLNGPNPFASPQSGESLIAPETTVNIQGVVSVADISRGLRNQRAIVIFLVSGFLMICLASILMRPMSAIIPLMVLSGVFFTFAFRQWRVGHRYVQQFGSGTGPICGHMNATELVLEFDQAKSLRAMEHLTFVKHTKDAMVLSFDAPILRFITLPYRLFDDPASARAIVYAAASHIQKRTFNIVDQRLQTNIPECSTPPSELAIHFSGDVQMQDLRRVSARTSKGTWLSAFLRVNVIPVLFAIYLANLGNRREGATLLMSALLLSVIGLMNFRLIRSLLQFQQKTPTDLVMRGCGWLDSTQMHYATGIGASTTQWPLYVRARVGTDVLGLQLPGNAQLHAILTRRQFKSEDDWKRAQALVRAHVSKVVELPT